MVFTLIFLFVTHCDLLLFASFSSLFSSISRMRQSSMLVRGVNLYLCHNMQVRFLQQTLFFTFSANPLHPFLLLDPRLLSRIPRQLVVLWMRTNMKGSVSLVILGQTCNSCKGLAFWVEFSLWEGQSSSRRAPGVRMAVPTGKGIALIVKLPGVLHMYPGFPWDLNHLQFLSFVSEQGLCAWDSPGSSACFPCWAAKSFFSLWISALHQLCCQVLPFSTSYFINVSRVVNATIFVLVGRTERCPGSFTSPRC